jgi:hypothetical protein
MGYGFITVSRMDIVKNVTYLKLEMLGVETYMFFFLLVVGYIFRLYCWLKFLFMTGLWCMVFILRPTAINCKRIKFDLRRHQCPSALLYVTFVSRGEAKRLTGEMCMVRQKSFTFSQSSPP